MRWALLAVALVAEVVGAAPPRGEPGVVTPAGGSVRGELPLRFFAAPEVSPIGSIAGTCDPGVARLLAPSVGSTAAPGSTLRSFPDLRLLSVGRVQTSRDDPALSSMASADLVAEFHPRAEPDGAREGRGETGARPCSQAGVLLDLGTVDLPGAELALQVAPVGGGVSQLINKVVSDNFDDAAGDPSPTPTRQQQHAKDQGPRRGS